MKLIEIRQGQTALVDAGGLVQEVNVSLIENPRKGDYVIVHVGFAIEKLDENEAMEQLALLGISVQRDRSHSDEIPQRVS